MCNAAESLLIHKSFPKQSVLKILVALSERNVQIRGCKKTKSIFKETISAKELDWYEEYLKPIIAVKIVSGIDEAMIILKNMVANTLMLSFQKIKPHNLDS